MSGKALARALLAASCLGGCKLVDQRTFEAKGATPSAAQLAQPSLPALPALTVSFAVPDADWRPSVRQAVLGAEAHNPDARFDVMVPFPTTGTPQVQQRYLSDGQRNGELVAREMQADGVPPERISLGFRGDPGAPAPDVRIYVR